MDKEFKIELEKEKKRNFGVLPKKTHMLSDSAKRFLEKKANEPFEYIMC
jgi:hypothetical protein